MRILSRVAICLMGFAVPAISGEMPKSTFRHPIVGRAECIPQVSTDPDLILKNHGIEVKNLPSTYRRYVAEAVSLMSDLHGKSMQALRGAKVVYNQKLHIVARQTTGPIELSPEGMGIKAIYVHEIGHVIGNAKAANGRTYYQNYGVKVPGKCHFTEYSRVSYGGFGQRNEEFAEVMTAYLLAPEMLLDGGPSCRQAYDFFRAEVFTAKDHKCESIEEQGKRIEEKMAALNQKFNIN